jgi:sugar phosphate isomerase/epimerase
MENSYMKNPWRGLINVGIVHPMIFPETGRGEGPILETIGKIAADSFFGAIEVSWMKDASVRDQAARLLGSAFLDVVYCGGPPMLNQKLDLNAFDDAVRAAAVNSTKKLIDEAYTLGARIIAIISGPDVEPKKREKAKSLLADSLEQVCMYAEEKGKGYTLMVSLEYFDREYDKKLLLGPTKEAADVVAKVKEKINNVGLTADLSHLPLLHETPKKALIEAKPYLEHVHVGNCVLKDRSHPQFGDQHPRFGVAGGENSVEELAEFLGVLKDIGYFSKKTATRLPVVSFEVKPAAGEVSEVLIANSKRVFAEAWSKI